MQHNVALWVEVSHRVTCWGRGLLLLFWVLTWFFHPREDLFGYVVILAAFLGASDFSRLCSGTGLGGAALSGSWLGVRGRWSGWLRFLGLFWDIRQMKVGALHGVLVFIASGARGGSRLQAVGRFIVVFSGISLMPKIAYGTGILVATACKRPWVVVVKWLLHVLCSVQSLYKKKCDQIVIRLSEITFKWPL